MQTGGGTRRIASDINVTPLVDVVLVLLIIFLVVAPMLHREEPVQLPRARNAAEARRRGEAIRLSLTADRRAFLDGREVARPALADELREELRRRPGAEVVLRGDRRLEYAEVREVLLEISRTRVAGVSLAAAQLDGEAP